MSIKLYKEPGAFTNDKVISSEYFLDCRKRCLRLYKRRSIR
jgi:hypothetical protein